MTRVFASLLVALFLCISFAQGCGLKAPPKPPEKKTEPAK
jgi:predicted small lipoprotein YifL